MEKPAASACKDQENSKHHQQQPQQQRVVWDCGSSLYDSFELKSFKRQLDSAIVSSRTNSMPCLSNRAPILSQTTEKTSSSSHVSTAKKSKISRSLQKFLRSVFRPKHTDSSAIFHVEEKYSHKNSHGRFYNVDAQPFGELLTTIPEIDLEMGNSKKYVDIDLHPEYYDDSAVVRKTVSERFTKRSTIGISCV